MFALCFIGIIAVIGGIIGMFACREASEEIAAATGILLSFIVLLMLILKALGAGE